MAAAPGPVEAPLDTEWRNPGNSVQVRLDSCAGMLCGMIVWANDEAITDAKRAGTARLVGTYLFRDFKTAGDGKWSGKVFVPDLRQTFSGTIHFEGENRMVGRGCLLFGVICKTQVWTRVR